MEGMHMMPGKKMSDAEMAKMMKKKKMAKKDEKMEAVHKATA